MWFYECTVFTGGIMQIGWATERCSYKSDEGVGIGDDEHSFAYDGCRGLLWHNQRHAPHQHRRWKPGDVLGLYLDLARGAINFSLNGDMLPGWLKLPGSKDACYFPAASLMTFQHVQFNFGNARYR